MITTVFFDCWGVLTHKRMRLFDSIIAELGLDESSHAYFVSLLDRMQVGRLSEEEFWQQFRAYCNIDPARQVSSWQEHYARVSAVDHDALALAKELRGRGLRTGILSNIDPLAVRYIQAAKVTEPFDLTIYSCDVGIEKPEAGIYRAALTAAAAQPEQTIFIDDKAENIVAAEALGMHGVVFENALQTRRALEKLLLASAARSR